MTALLVFLSARRKAISGFVSAEAATFLTAAGAGPLTGRSVVIAALTPLAAGVVIERVRNR